MGSGGRGPTEPGPTHHPYVPNTKLSGLKIWPKGPGLTESMVPGSRSTRMARGTYLLPAGTQQDSDLALAEQSDNALLSGLYGQSSSQKIPARCKEQIRGGFCSTKGGEGLPGHDPNAGNFRGSEGISEQLTFKCMQGTFLCRVCVFLLHWGCQRTEHRRGGRARGSPHQQPHCSTR